jgi:hypothetical protein
MAHDEDQWQATVNMVMKFQVQEKINFFTF